MSTEGANGEEQPLRMEQPLPELMEAIYIGPKSYSNRVTEKLLDPEGKNKLLIESGCPKFSNYVSLKTGRHGVTIDFGYLEIHSPPEGYAQINIQGFEVSPHTTIVLENETALDLYRKLSKMFSHVDVNSLQPQVYTSTEQNEDG